MKKCEECNGTGQVECEECDGSGEIINTCNLGFKHEEDCEYCVNGNVDCPECDGSGELDDDMAEERNPDEKHDNT